MPIYRAGLEVHLVMDNYGTHKVKQSAQVVSAPSSLSRPFHAHRAEVG